MTWSWWSKRAAFAVAAGWLFAIAPAAASPADDAGDPITTSAESLFQLVRAKCVPGDQPITIGVASVPVEEQAFTKDQGNHLMNAVHSAFSRIPGAKMAPFRDVGAMMELTSAGMTEGPEAGDVDAMLKKIQIVVKASGQRIGSDVRFQLTAVGLKPVDCFESTAAVDVPARFAGEIYMPADSLFDLAARALWQRARGDNEVVVHSTTVNGVALEPQLPGYFTSMLRRAVSSAESSATVIIGSPTKLRVVSLDDASFGADQRWNADVSVEHRKNGIRVSIDLTKTDDTPIAYAGLVSEDDLPALSRLDLQNVALVKPVGGPRKPVGPAELTLGSLPTRVLDAVDDRAREQRYNFKLAKDSWVEFDVTNEGDAAKLPPEVMSARGVKAVAINPPGARVNLRRYRLPPGEYVAGVKRQDPGRQDYILKARAVAADDIFEPEAPGRLLRKFQDWYVGEMKRGDARVCYAYTPATDVTPVGWREQRPIIWLSVGENGSDLPNHQLDDIARYDRALPLRATIRGLDEAQVIQVGATNRNIQPLDLKGAIHGYTVGSSLSLEGTTADGRPTHVDYSLQGYRSAINAMAIACKRSDIADAFVWR